MDDRRKILVVFVFLLIELGLSFYVFNYTARDRSPTLTYPTEELGLHQLASRTLTFN